MPGRNARRDPRPRPGLDAGWQRKTKPDPIGVRFAWLRKENVVPDTGDRGQARLYGFQNTAKQGLFGRRVARHAVHRAAGAGAGAGLGYFSQEDGKGDDRGLFVDRQAQARGVELLT